MKRHNYKIQGGSNLISFAVMACSAFLVGTLYAAGPWYVDVNDPNAADTLCEGRGTEALPFKTIQAALDNSSFEVGDTVYVTFTLTNCAAWSGNITYIRIDAIAGTYVHEIDSIQLVPSN